MKAAPNFETVLQAVVYVQNRLERLARGEGAEGLQGQRTSR